MKEQKHILSVAIVDLESQKSNIINKVANNHGRLVHPGPWAESCEGYGGERRLPAFWGIQTPGEDKVTIHGRKLYVSM